MKNNLDKKQRQDIIYKAKDYEKDCSLSLRRNIEDSVELKGCNLATLDTNDSKFMKRKESLFPLAKPVSFLSDKNFLRCEGIVCRNAMNRVVAWDAKMRRNFKSSGKMKSCDIALLKHFEEDVFAKYLTQNPSQRTVLNKIKNNILSFSEKTILTTEKKIGTMKEKDFISFISFVEGGPLFYKTSVYKDILVEKYFLVYDPKEKGQKYMLVNIDWDKDFGEIIVKAEQKNSGVYYFNFYDQNGNIIYQFCQKNRYKEDTDAYIYLENFSSIDYFSTLDEMTLSFLEMSFLDVKYKKRKIKLTVSEISKRIDSQKHSVMALSDVVGEVSLEQKINPLDVRTYIENMEEELSKKEIYISKAPVPQIYKL